MRVSAGFSVVGAILALTLGGCASLVDGGMQKVSVETVGPKGVITAANCELRNSKGSSFVPATPDVALVYRDGGPLSVVCTKNGLPETSVTVRPSMNKVDVANVLSAGIGEGVDIADGAGYSYPSRITVRMEKQGGEASIRLPQAAAKG